MTAVLTATSITNQPTGPNPRTHQAQIRRVRAALPAPVNRRIAALRGTLRRSADPAEVSVSVSFAGKQCGNRSAAVLGLG